MTDRRIGDETLNAYVDGELTTTAAAEVARAAAQSPAIAARIATLREMKAAVADLVPGASFALPELPRRRFRTWPAAAACLALVLVAGALLSGLVGLDGAGDRATLLQAHHRSWSFDREPEPGRASPVSDGAGGLDTLDLSAARLAFVGREWIAFGAATILRVGFEGTRGCRLSLFRLPAELNVSAAAFAAPLHARVLRWDGHDVLIMAEGMAVSRFRDLAEAIERVLRERRPFDAETRQRLALARATSRPCQA
ncbi:MAG: hypothetical protein L6R19_05390 [Alphaproteobacteria bacterium]|nr:hypothetical protein [Alphaproteobacteria bacterium]